MTGDMTSVPGMKRERHMVHWFRKGLRLHDNPAFCEGLKGAVTFRCIFIIDPWFAGSSNVGINKWRFLLQCLEDLDHNLRKINSRLFVVRGQPADALPKLFKEWGTTCLTFEEDPEPFGKVRDHKITQLCKELEIEVIQAVSHTLYKLEKIIERNGSRPPFTYNQFQGIIESMDPPPHAVPAVAPETVVSSTTPTSDDHDDRFGVPSLDELGFETENLRPPVWIGGETEALARLERHLERKAWVASFGRPKMTPQSLLASQTGLSPYLRFGCLSTRLFYHQLTDLYKKIKKAQPPLSLHGQLLWREFFYCAATKNENFDKMEGNPICVQIPWDRNPEALAKWANGQTGFPWIDAIMTQLQEEGWIHHLARHAVACFLTRGDLWISWEEGMKVFEELCLDADWSMNAGMWMWLSSSSFFQQFLHCYCPVRFGRKADPNGDYIRRYLPVLKNFPTRYIHEPWNAPVSVQKAAKCIIGKEYSFPIVNHAIASRTNMERLRQVYRQLYKYREPKIYNEFNKVGYSIVPASNEKQRNYVQAPSTHQLNRSNHQQHLQQHQHQQAIQLSSNYVDQEQQHATHQNTIEAQQPLSAYSKMNQKDFSSAHEKAPECQNAQYNRIILHRNIGLADDSDEPMKEGVTDQMIMQYNNSNNTNNNNNSSNNNNINQQTENESPTEQQQQQALQRDNTTTFLNQQNHNNIDLGMGYQQTPQDKQPLQIRLAETFTNFAINDANRMQSNRMHGNENDPTENMTCNLDANDV